MPDHSTRSQLLDRALAPSIDFTAAEFAVAGVEGG